MRAISIFSKRFPIPRSEPQRLHIVYMFLISIIIMNRFQSVHLPVCPSVWVIFLINMLGKYRLQICWNHCKILHTDWSVKGYKPQYNGTSLLFSKLKTRSFYSLFIFESVCAYVLCAISYTATKYYRVLKFFLFFFLECVFWAGSTTTKRNFLNCLRKIILFSMDARCHYPLRFRINKISSDIITCTA